MDVVVVGASDNPERYSHRALLLLKEKGHRVIPIHPRLTGIESVPVYHSLKEIKGPVHTVTLYVGRERSDGMIEDILGLKPRRLIMNPGAENDALEVSARNAGIEVIRGCTIIMLRTGQF
jgi:predicted CoA-binding protein